MPPLVNKLTEVTILKIVPRFDGRDVSHRLGAVCGLFTLETAFTCLHLSSWKTDARGQKGCDEEE